MINFTAPDGSPVMIDGALVIRARRTVSGEQLENGARTRIDWPMMQLVEEPLEQVSAAIRQELATFVFLTARDGSKIWFNALKATGPVILTPSQDDGIVRSSIRLMSYRQFVTESPAEVRELLSDNGGTVLP